MLQSCCRSRYQEMIDCFSDLLIFTMFVIGLLVDPNTGLSIYIALSYVKIGFLCEENRRAMHLRHSVLAFFFFEVFNFYRNYVLRCDIRCCVVFVCCDVLMVFWNNVFHEISFAFCLLKCFVFMLCQKIKFVP